MPRIGIYGATGYTGYELIKLLANHAEAEIVFATSRSNAGGHLSDLYPPPPVLGGRQQAEDLVLIAPEEAPLGEVDVVFCCLPHTESIPVVVQALEAGVRAIDLSADFRLRDAVVYQQWYKAEHTAPAYLSRAVYGLPEVYRQQIAAADLVAGPGCYPTGALLALYPLVVGGYLSSPRVIVDAKSGVSGAGRTLRLSSHFVEANENFSPYSIGRAHRHLCEIEQELNAWADAELRVTFSPHLLPVDRGILSTIYVTLQPGWSVERLRELYAGVYAEEPFIRVLLPGKLTSLNDIVHTNRCVLAFAEAGGNDFIVVSAIDNLIKGASGQILQCMNLMYGLDETMGLPV